MFDAMQISATGMRSHQLQIETISHNVANMNTVGFRRKLVSFAEVSMDAAALLSTAPPNGLLTSAVSRGVGSFASVSLSNLAGELRQTGEPLDVAIEGAGFLEVLRGDGSVAYTRAGSLHLNEAGELATASGETLAAEIAVPVGARQIQITSDGRVLAVLDDASGPVQLGQIELVAFANPAALTAVGDNLYVATEQTGELQAAHPGESGMGTLRQGYVEASNVQMIDELVALMIAQRAFEMNSRVAQAADQVQSITNGLIR